MGVTFQEPANHLKALRTFLSRLRRMRTMPSVQELARAAESLAALEKAISESDPPSFEVWAPANGYNIAPAVLPIATRIYADRECQAAFDAWTAGAAHARRTSAENPSGAEALQERLLALAISK